MALAFSVLGGELALDPLGMSLEPKTRAGLAQNLAQPWRDANALCVEQLHVELGERLGIGQQLD